MKNYEKGEIQTDEDWIKEEEDGNIVEMSSLVFKKHHDFFYYRPSFILTEKAYNLFQKNKLYGIKYIEFYKKTDSTNSENILGYLNEYGGYEVIMNGKSSMNGVDINSFPKIEKKSDMK